MLRHSSYICLLSANSLTHGCFIELLLEMCFRSSSNNGTYNSVWGTTIRAQACCMHVLLFRCDRWNDKAPLDTLAFLQSSFHCGPISRRWTSLWHRFSPAGQAIGSGDVVGGQLSPSLGPHALAPLLRSYQALCCSYCLFMFFAGRVFFSEAYNVHWRQRLLHVSDLHFFGEELFE